MGYSVLVCLDLTGPGSVQAGVPVEGEVAVHHPLEVHVDDCLCHLRHHCRRLGRKERGEMVGVPGWKVSRRARHYLRLWQRRAGGRRGATGHHVIEECRSALR